MVIRTTKTTKLSQGSNHRRPKNAPSSALLLKTSKKLSERLRLVRRQDVANDRETDWVSVAVFLSNSVIEALVFRFLRVKFPELVEAYDARKEELRTAYQNEMDAQLPNVHHNGLQIRCTLPQYWRGGALYHYRCT